MNTYKVTGFYTISFEMEVEAESREEAEWIGNTLYIQTEWNNQSVFVDPGEASLEADGMPFDVKAELINGKEEDE